METAIFIFIHVLIHIGLSAFLVTVVSDYDFRRKIGLKGKRIRKVLLIASILPAINLLVVALIGAMGIKEVVKDVWQKFMDALNEEDD